MADSFQSLYVLSQSRSLYSTRRLFQEAFKKKKKVKVYPPLDLSMLLDRNRTELFFQGKKIIKPDCLIPRVGQQKSSYTLAVVRQFEMMGTTVLNSSQAMGRARDKLRTLQILAQKNIAMVRTFFLDALIDVDLAIKMVGGAPLIIKVTQGTQGMGVMLAESIRSARSILQGLLNQNQHVLVQEFVSESQGEDIRAIILGNRLLTAMRRTSFGDDFRSNVHRGGSAEKVVLDAETQQTALQAARALGLRFAGVDIIPSKRGPLVVEVNPSPGLEGIEKASGLNIAKSCIDYLEELHRDEHKGDVVGY